MNFKVFIYHAISFLLSDGRIYEKYNVKSCLTELCLDSADFIDEENSFKFLSWAWHLRKFHTGEMETFAAEPDAKWFPRLTCVEKL